MNILLGILKYPPDYAGDGLRLHRTFQRLKKKGVLNQARVLTSWHQSSKLKDHVRDGIEIYREVECTLKPSFKRWHRKIKYLFEIFCVISRYLELAPKTDLVITSGSGWFPSLIAWLGFLTHKPVVKEIVLLGSDDPISVAAHKHFWSRWFFTQPFHFSKLIVAISPALQSACLEFGLTNEKIWSRFNPVDFETSDLTATRGQGKTPVILWVGCITRRKNVLFLVQAACHLHLPAKFVIVGPSNDKKYMEEIKLAMKDLPPHVEIEFKGQEDDPRALQRIYSQAALFWFASIKEGMGNVVAESLVCGTPVLTLPVMGIMKQVIPHPQDGEIIDTRDPSEFALAACRWLVTKHDHAGISKRARERFNTDAIDAQYAARLIKILSAHDIPRRAQTLTETPALASERI